MPAELEAAGPLGARTGFLATSGRGICLHLLLFLSGSTRYAVSEIGQMGNRFTSSGKILANLSYG